MRYTLKNRFFIFLVSVLCCFPSESHGAIPLILAPAPIVVPPIIVTVTKAALVTSTAAGLVFSFFFKKQKPQPCSCKNGARKTTDSSSHCNCGCGCNFTCGCTCGCGCNKIKKNIENSAHNSYVYENLKKDLKNEEFTSVTKYSKHGFERLKQRFTASEIQETLNKADFITVQDDGARVFIKKIAEKFNCIIVNPQTDEVITGLSNISKQSLINLGKNYGWTLPW